MSKRRFNTPPSEFRGRSVPRFTVYFLLTLLIPLIEVLTQTGWDRVSGGSQTDLAPQCVAILNSHSAVAAGLAGNIFRTNDGGATWTQPVSGVTADLRAICFSDEYHGTIVGNLGTILRSDDGGATWRKQENGPFDWTTDFITVEYGDAFIGMAISAAGRLYRTTNGGASWMEHERSFSYMFCIRLRGLVGFTAGTNGHISRTNDGGETWTPQQSGTNLRLYDISIQDNENVVIVGDYGTIVRTTDGGSTWTQAPRTSFEHYRAVAFYDPLHGLIGGAQGTTLRTGNGGGSWSEEPDSTMRSMFDLAFHSSAFGLAVTRDDGKIFRTSDGAGSWDEVDYSWFGKYFGVCSTGPDSVFAVGERGTVMFSADAGVRWTRQSAPTSATLRGIAFTDPGTGWLVGDSGTILHTSDAGATWSRQTSGTARTLHAVAFGDPSTGTIVGEQNTILQTTNAGALWNSRPADVFGQWCAISFADPVNGIAVGSDGVMVGSSDRGYSWRLVRHAPALYGTSWADPNTNITVGRYRQSLWPGMLRSTDRGITWTESQIGPSIAGREWMPRGVGFSGAHFGCVVGDDGRLFVTQDSGSTWADRSPTGITLNAISIPDQRTAYVAGDSGIILRMRSVGTIQGTAYDDRDHDTVKGPTEPYRSGWPLYLDGPVRDSCVSDIDGRYAFRSLPFGTYRVRTAMRPFWEQTAPPVFPADTVTIAHLRETITNYHFGITGPIVRVKIPIYVSDNTSFAHRFVWYGIRPGTTFGIWGPDLDGSLVDSLEGEFEIPPRGFVEDAGIFDARFTDPAYPLNEASVPFGEGGWTDMRPFRYAEQVDTFLLSFLPGFYYGGNYPMTIRWPRDLISASFNGPVVLTGSGGAPIDMKWEEGLTIEDPGINSFLLISKSPNLPSDWLAEWHLVSLPRAVPDGNIRSLFPSAESKAYAFIPGLGYEDRDTVHPNIGYWLKYTRAMDTVIADSTARRFDTVRVSAGWNLIGALSVPVDAASITTDPADLTHGYFFRYRNGYSIADSLIPGAGYWVWSEADGAIVLDAAPDGPGEQARGDPDPRRTRSGPVPIDFRDAHLNRGTLYVAPDESGEAGRYRLPPFPPIGAFDVRYSSHRAAEPIPRDGIAEYVITVSSPRFPLAISLSESLPVSACLRLGGQIVPLRPGEPVIIHQGRDLVSTGDGGRYIFSLILTGRDGQPADYALLQNYPNPFNPSTLIAYSLPVDSRVKIGIYNVVGQEVAILVDDVQEAGYRTLNWDARGVATGIYFYRMDAVGLADPARFFSTARKLVVVR